MKYFNNISTLEELRKQYKELLKKYHPDNTNGSEEATKAINAEYDNLFKLLKDKHTNTDNKVDDSKTTYEDMKYNFEEDEKLREVLQNIIILQGINIEIIGSWLWVDGDTYAHKDTLKALGFRWAKEKKKWYFHPESFRKRSNKKLSMNDIRNYYGSTKVKASDERKAIEA